ncbi:interferon alpha-inducible protein 27-like protein 2B isoform X1 [Acanthochromis polyacanthus]|uniref:interferon alpha-inducible protein 27-like protein 2B isoform X1 n=1 Tax=Acanthochromis polyacanthus TaxID=80966 RepID=UPI000B8FA06E|nr:interferon alpha-inducible protein 27-like protein 2B isoform X1 [Acanthochromis polyacanthus]
MGSVTVAGLIVWAVVLVPVALGAIDFTSAGRAAGSYAAGMMSSAAIGGGVAAESLVAVLQSAGMPDLSGSATEAWASVANKAESLMDVLQSARMADLSGTATKALTSVTNKAENLIDVLQSTALASAANGGRVAAESLMAVLQSTRMPDLSGTVAEVLTSVTNKAENLMAVLQSADHVPYVCGPHQTLHECAADIFAENKGVITAVAIVTGAGGAVVLAPVAVGAMGFTSSGIAAGSYAAGMMSSAAIANGGGVAAGSLVAVLQSAGAAGLSATANAAVAGVGAAVGWWASFIG